MSINFLTLPAKRLAETISASASTFKVNNLEDWAGTTLTATDFGTIHFVVFRNSSNTLMELMKIDPTGITASSITISKRGLKFDGDQSTEVSANKLTWVKGDTIIEFGSNPPQLYEYLKEYIDAASIAGAVNATASVKGIVEVATQAEIDAGTATGATGASIATTPDQLALSIYATRLPTANQKLAIAGLSTTAVSATNLLVDERALTGIIVPFGGRTAITGWLLCDGSAVSRTTYASLLAVICPSQTFTVTIASPGVFSATSHGLVLGDKVHFTTTGGLPSGLAANTDYYVISAGLTSSAFEVALSPSGAAVNTTGSQSGVHTVYKGAYGKGDGSTTFNVPDLRSRVPLGLASAAPTTQTLSFEPAAVSAGSDNVTILNTVFPAQGQLITLSASGGATLPGGLSATTYYIVRSSSTTIQFATSQANANAETPVVVNITDQGSGTGAVFTMTFTGLAHTVLGRMGGEETHGLSAAELAAHKHSLNNIDGGGLSSVAKTTVSSANNQQVEYSGLSGGNVLHNIMQPYITMNYLIKT
jgi:microcystin-dependent protein